MRVYLTAGHNVVNGKGTGAFGVPCLQYPDGFDEAREAIVLRDLVSDHLRLHGVPVDNDDNATPLRRVLDWLRQVARPNDWCIEIHFNAAAATASGVECVVANDHTMKERDMARGICKAVNNAAGIRIRERAPGREGVIIENETARGRIAFLRSPAAAHNVLVEVCFCTNKKDVEKYFTHRKAIARRIAENIIINL